MVDSCLPEADEVDVLRCKNSTTLQNEDQVPVMGDDRFLYKTNSAQCVTMLAIMILRASE